MLYIINNNVLVHISCRHLWFQNLLSYINHILDNWVLFLNPIHLVVLYCCWALLWSTILRVYFCLSLGGVRGLKPRQCMQGNCFTCCSISESPNKLLFLRHSNPFLYLFIQYLLCLCLCHSCSGQVGSKDWQEKKKNRVKGNSAFWPGDIE